MPRRMLATTEAPAWPRTVIVFIWAFLGVGVMTCAWSFATPIGAAPDEPAHIVQAVAIVRGQFDEPTHHSPLGSIASVRVPGWAADTEEPCFVKFDVFTRFPLTGVAAACPDRLSDATKPALAPTQFSNAPPLYYVVVGIPSLFLSGETALYAMRLTSGLLNAALVALGISLLIRYHPRRTPLVGVLLALSPMVLFLMAVVSSSGLEISAGFATWCGGLCVVEHPQIPRALAIWTALAAVLLVLSRPTSPLDAVIITVVLALLIGWQGLRQRLNSSLVPLWSPVLVAAIVAGGFLLAFGAPRLTGVPPVHPAGLLSNMWTNLRFTGVRLRQCIGDFGWLDTPVPTWVVIVWTSAVAGLTVCALTLSAPCRRALPVLALLILAMPEILRTSDGHRLCQLAGKVLAPGGGRVPPGGLDLAMAITPARAPPSRRTMGRPDPRARVGARASRRPGCLVHACPHTLRGRPRCSGGITYTLVAARRSLPGRGGLRGRCGRDSGARGLRDDVASREGRSHECT